MAPRMASRQPSIWRCMRKGDGGGSGSRAAVRTRSYQVLVHSLKAIIRSIIFKIRLGYVKRGALAYDNVKS
jgi:hypothetical protein